MRVNADPFGDRRDHGCELGYLVLGEKADLQIEFGAFLGRWAMRFCVISTKVDRKIASTEAAIARIVKDGSNAGIPKTLQILITIQRPNSSRWK